MVFWMDNLEPRFLNILWSFKVKWVGVEKSPLFAHEVLVEEKKIIQ